MSKVESLAIHTPVALPYLIKEGILPRNPKKDLYDWETYVSSDDDGATEEEVVATKRCVVWSRGGFVKNVYRFGLEGENVVQALLTSFPDAGYAQPQELQHGRGVRKMCGSTQSTSRRSTGRTAKATKHQAATKSYSTQHETLSRALVVILKTKAHIHFLQGSSHILDLPFEIARAFPAPRGLLLQRKLFLPPTHQRTPQVPPAQHKSSLSSQIPHSSSYLQSPTLSRSLGSTQPTRAGPSGGSGQLEALFQVVIGSPSEWTDDEPASLYSLTNPLTDVGVVSYSLHRQKPRISSKTSPGLTVEFECLKPAEEIVYVSQKDELQSLKGAEHGPLVLVVTLNRELRSVTLWHAWYIEERSLRSLLNQCAAKKDAKARRRSSFLSAGMGTGATTPAVRQRDVARESFVGAGSIRLPGEPVASYHVAVTSSKPTRQEEEEVMASQLDPDYQPTAPQPPGRETRRISSLNADARSGQSAPNPSFASAGGRRNASFGGPNDRKSLGHRKSRGSTPGSVFSRSLGPHDDIMDMDSNADADGDDTVESAVRHIRATFAAARPDGVFIRVDDSFKQELVVRKLHSFPIWSPKSPPDSKIDIRAATLSEVRSSSDGQDSKISIYAHNRSSKQLSCVDLLVKQRALWPETPHSPFVAVPLFAAESNVETCEDIIVLQDRRLRALLLGNNGLLLSADNKSMCPLPPQTSYRVYNALHTFDEQGGMNKEVGKNRTLSPPAEIGKLEHSGAEGSFDEVDQDGTHHRKRIQLAPTDASVDGMLTACELVLPSHDSVTVRRTWCLACAWLSCHTGAMKSTAASIEAIAFVATIFVYIVPILDEKARAALNLARMAAGKETASESASLHLGKRQHESKLLSNPAWSWIETHRPPSIRDSVSSPGAGRPLHGRKDQLLPIAAALALELQPPNDPKDASSNALVCAIRLMLGLHILREEQKLCTLPSMGASGVDLAPVIAQIGGWLSIQSWSFATGSYYFHEGANETHWSSVKSAVRIPPTLLLMDEPVGVFQWFEHTMQHGFSERYPSLDVIAGLFAETAPTRIFTKTARVMTPRIDTLCNIYTETAGLTVSASTTVETMARCGIDTDVLETLPEAIAAPFRDAISKCEREPPTIWSKNLLQLIGREDLDVEMAENQRRQPKSSTNTLASPRDIRTICHAVDHNSHSTKTREAGRHAISQLIFHEDRRLVEATSLMHYSSVQVAECPKQPDWSDSYHFEHCRRVMQYVVTRMIALPVGDAMIHYDCQTPLLTEKFNLLGFSSACLMQPMKHTLQVDRSGLTEEKVNWAYFHAGASAGLRISRKVTGIDTSWVAFNKPSELTNRHAGLLLALGLNGHLRSLAKWLSFKYLTPKHTMTSVGLLLGLSASYIGTMDSLITRMLSVHITRMLPPGAAELNVSCTTQTAGLMGIGLLYHNTQHRRMSEIMLSEIENLEPEDPDNGPDTLRDESYRLAAGFALGLINLGKGNSLHGLHGMHLPERLLSVAVGSRPVSAVHVFDRATAGAIIAIALVYMKTGDRSIACKVDIPDTEAQFDHVRPDMLLLRAMARHLILWNGMPSRDSSSDKIQGWIASRLPACYKGRFRSSKSSYDLKSSDLAFYNILTGLAWAYSLKFAGSGNLQARTEVLSVFDLLHKDKAAGYSDYYDAKLARSTLRRCMDVLALSAATIMAGTGDLETFRYLRRQHGRTNAETPYGSHLAAHLAVGILFLGGGTYTLGTSDLATASLLCAFYPLFPTDVQDNHGHLQAFRHLWVFAAEARCVVAEDFDTHKPIEMPIRVMMRDGSIHSMRAPCLLPELDTIASVRTDDPAYWCVTLDFAANPAHLQAFKQNQRVYLRRCPASEACGSVFSATLAALNDVQSSQAANNLWHSVFSLPALRDLDKAELEIIFSPDHHSSVHTDEHGTSVDDRLVLSNAALSTNRDQLWNLSMLFSWAERAKEEGNGKLGWIGVEIIEGLKERIDKRSRSTSVAEV